MTRFFLSFTIIILFQGCYFFDFEDSNQKSESNQSNLSTDVEQNNTKDNEEQNNMLIIPYGYIQVLEANINSFIPLHLQQIPIMDYEQNGSSIPNELIDLEF